MKKSEFKHKIIETVRFHEVDLMGIVNNAIYFTYFEDARISYTNTLKHLYKFKEILEGDSFFIMARNECNYLKSAHFGDELTIYTKVILITNKSFHFVHLVENNKTGEIIAEGGGVFVHINLKTKKSQPLPEEFYLAVKDYEGEVVLKKEDENLSITPE